MKSERIKSLDGLRGIAAVSVAFLYHYHMFGVDIPFKGLAKVLSDTGWLAVDIFFVISGFVISYTYESKIRDEELTFSHFIGRRIKHLYPIMHVTLLVCTIEHLLFFYKEGKAYWFSYFDVKHFLLNFLGIQTGWLEATLSFNGPAWSISVELFLYIMFYYLVKSTKQKKSTLHFGIGIGILGGLIVLQRNLMLPILNVLMARGILCFLEGMLIKELWLQYKKGKFAKGYINCSIWASGTIVFGWCILCCILRTDSWIWGGSEPNAGILFVFDVVIAPMSIWLALTGKLATRILNMRVLRALGNISLEIYMWHFPVMIFIVLLDKFNVIHLLDKDFLFLIYVSGVIVIAAVYKGLIVRISRR